MFCFGMFIALMGMSMIAIMHMGVHMGVQVFVSMPLVVYSMIVVIMLFVMRMGMAVGMMVIMAVPLTKEMYMSMTTFTGKPLPEHPDTYCQDNSG